MAEQPQPKDVELFDRTVKSLAAAIKNSTLYPPGHPSFVSSITALKNLLDAWLSRTETLEIGIAPDNLLANGAYFKKEGDPLYAEVGSYLHQRGIISVAFKRGVPVAELEAFFAAVKCDPKACASSGGILKSMPKAGHILVREIDYSALLKVGGASREAPEPHDKDVWQSLVLVAAMRAGEELPLSKVEFLNTFLVNPEKSAGILNKIYKEALAKVDDNATVEKMRSALLGISRYFQRTGSADAMTVRKDIADIILRLDPALVARLFEEGAPGGAGAALSDEIMRDLSDDTVADFIASMVGREGAVNKHLLKFFDKLTHDGHRAGNMSALVADKLFDMRSLNKDLLGQLQSSVKEMLKTSPENSFLSEMYRMTVETFVDSSVGLAYRSDEYLRLARESAESLKFDSLQRQEVRLLLNLLWLERDPASFGKLCTVLARKLDPLLDVLYIQVAREVYEFFLEKMDPAIRAEKAFAGPAAPIVARLTSVETLGKVVALVRDAGPFELNNIARILKLTKPASIRLAIDSFALSEDELTRDRSAQILMMLGADIVPDLVRKLEHAAGLVPSVVLGLFDIVKRLDPQEAQEASRILLRQKDARVQAEALALFTPQTAADASALLDLLKTEIGDEVAHRILHTLLRSPDARVIDLIFRSVRRGPLRGRYLEAVVKLCGDFKVTAAFPELRDIFVRRPFFYTRSADAVRVAACVSLAQIGTPEAMALVTRGLADPSEAVRRMSGIILELDKKKGGEMPRREGP